VILYAKVMTQSFAKVFHRDSQEENKLIEDEIASFLAMTRK
jgi:hypothetical protein